jgi:hypothetical protein
MYTHTIRFALALALMLGVLSACRPVADPEGISVTPAPAKQAKLAATISLTLPVWGNYAASSEAIKWFNVPGSPAHKAFATFDDTQAVDLNLADNRETKLPVVAPLSGTVTSLGTTYPGTLDGGTLGAVLIDHGGGLFTAYMHLNTIKVKSKDVVKAGQELGTIGNKGVTAIHLHMAAYRKEGSVLVSKPITFSNRPFAISLAWQVLYDSKGKPLPDAPLKVGGAKQLTGAVPFGAKGDISSGTYYPNTFWSSDNVKVAKVDGNGRVTGVAKGNTTIRVKFSGQEFTLAVTVS